MKVIIIGAGMGGATAGIALQHCGYQVEIFEAVRQSRFGLMASNA
jgi:2-polyprenyl-6-methoxyphenol hydroxylase-like FAD-dependent oxidoreductase